jgi:hypothetical protein
LAVRGSAVLAASWLAIVVYAFVKFKKRGLWFLLGTPMIVFWLFVLFVIAWVKCPRLLYQSQCDFSVDFWV